MSLRKVCLDFLTISIPNKKKSRNIHTNTHTHSPLQEPGTLNITSHRSWHKVMLHFFLFSIFCFQLLQHLKLQCNYFIVKVPKRFSRSFIIDQTRLSCFSGSVGLEFIIKHQLWSTLLLLFSPPLSVFSDLQITPKALVASLALRRTRWTKVPWVSSIRAKRRGTSHKKVRGVV